MTESIDRLISIVTTLRGPNGCPWDKEQTFQSLTPYIIEEAYELVEAMKTNDTNNLKEELGDVLLHVVMLTLMAHEQSKFSIDDVANQISEKMIRRHPHVFATEKIDTSAGVLTRWEAIKQSEQKDTNIGLLDSIPRHMPATMQAQKLQKKAAKSGFDWPHTADVLEKIKEEINELEDAAAQNSPTKLQEEFGDVLFSIVNLGRKMGIDCEAALQTTNHKFRSRWKKMESDAAKNHQALDTLSLQELETLWIAAKKESSL